MFGAKAGEERFQGKLNQFVVTRLSGKSRAYWIFHTRGEDPMSVLVSALKEQDLPEDDVLRLGSAVKERQTLNEKDWNAVAQQQTDCNVVLQWGKGVDAPKVDLHKAVQTGAATSRVLGWESFE